MIILDSGKYSSIFKLERGTAQGDSPSPFLYNLAAQVLLWKLEYDPQIEGIYPNPNRAGNRPVIGKAFVSVRLIITLMGEI